MGPTTPSVHITLSSTAIMIIYKDILTDDEIISDVYDLKEIDGVVYEADCKMIKIGGESLTRAPTPPLRRLRRALKTVSRPRSMSSIPSACNQPSSTKRAISHTSRAT